MRVNGCWMFSFRLFIFFFLGLENMVEGVGRMVDSRRVLKNNF